MQLATKYFSNIEYQENEVIFFENGLFGFERYTKFILIRFDNQDNSLICLQSTEETNIAFVMLNPYNFIPDYRVSLSKMDCDDLQLNNTDPFAVYTICVLQDDVPKSTTNLKCPVIVNTENRFAKQIILDNPEYPYKYPFQKLINKEG